MAVDFNPDKEGHVQHKFIVQKRTRAPDEHVPGHPELRYGHGGRLTVNDEKLAREIQKESVADVCVTRTRYPHASDRGHVYFFGAFKGVPWAKYDELGRRIETKE